MSKAVWEFPALLFASGAVLLALHSAGSAQTQPAPVVPPPSPSRAAPPTSPPDAALPQDFCGAPAFSEGTVDTDGLADPAELTIFARVSMETVTRPSDREDRDPAAEKRPPLIQRLPLDSFTLTAVQLHSNPDKILALVEDSGGVGYLIRKGTKIGPDGGVVTEITDGKVVIEEPEFNNKGENSVRRTELFLNSSPEDSSLSK